MNKITVFGGWAVPPEILMFFLCDAVDNIDTADVNYIDVNRVMPKLFNEYNLRDDWAGIVAGECRLIDNDAPDVDVIVGWSTGAMFAYAVSAQILPKKTILIAATPCFCKRGDFPFGTNPAVVDQMIVSLKRSRDGVLRSFYELCGLNRGIEVIPDYSVSELICGLHFLKQADLRPMVAASAPSVKPVFYHGRNDRIIPIAAARYFCERTGGAMIESDGGHAFFSQP
jgi:pimeloyl-ACP methyl ester carboxylesterase